MEVPPAVHTPLRCCLTSISAAAVAGTHLLCVTVTGVITITVITLIIVIVIIITGHRVIAALPAAVRVGCPPSSLDR